MKNSSLNHILILFTLFWFSRFELSVVNPIGDQILEYGKQLSLELPIDIFESDDVITLSVESPDWINAESTPPRVLSTIDISAKYAGAYTVYSRHPFLYVSTTTSNRFAILNVTDPRTPDWVSETPILGGGQNDNIVEKKGEKIYAYVLTNSVGPLTIFDVTDPEIIVETSTTSESPGISYQLDKHGDFVYVCDNTGNQLHIFNVSDPYNPFRTSQIAVTAPRDVKVVKTGNIKLAYLAGFKNFYVINVTDEYFPVEVFYDFNEFYSAVRINVKGDYAFVEDYFLFKLKVYDISDPINPTFYRELYAGSGIRQNDLKYGGPDNNWLFTTTYRPGVNIINITDVDNLEFIYELENYECPVDKKKCYSLSTSSTSRNRFYLGCWTNIQTYDYGSLNLTGYTESVENCGENLIKVWARTNTGEWLEYNFTLFLDWKGNIVEPKHCSVFSCNSLFSNDTGNVCNGHGNCTYSTSTAGLCNCDTGWEFSTFCGTCAYGYLMENGKCKPFCYNKFYNDTEVCSSHGKCVELDKCGCYENYTFSDQCFWKCFGEMKNDTASVCSGHGSCLDHNECDCLNPPYSGSYCQYWTCFGRSAGDLTNVCGGHGACIAQDLCGCHSGYYSPIKFGDPCIMWKCGNIEKNNPSVCTSRGNCTGADICECQEDFIGSNCETFECYGIDQSEKELVCSGSGDCEEPNKCSCGGIYFGKKCNYNILYYVVMTPTLTFMGFFFIVSIICCMICCAICLCCCCCLIVICLCSGLYRQRKKVKRFKKLKDFDLLLKEQEMDDDGSIAHLRINQGLFQVPYDELTLVRILGEGGSASTVYLARWKGSDVAFKSFRTRSICNTQDSFDEFEREVSILANVNHPFVLQFLGCSMQHPRIGIVMEYCVGGDLSFFLKNYRVQQEKEEEEEEESNGYPFEEKYRVCSEIASAMEYLHSRSIIHRDLKLENILLDSKESCKVMDFGLSKLVTRMSQTKTKKVGTSIYMAPEIITSTHYDEKCDVFSFGIMLFIIFTEDFQPYGDDAYGIEIRVAGNPDLRPDTSNIEKHIPPEYSWLKDTMEQCWLQEPLDRLNFTSICELFSKKKDFSDFVDLSKPKKKKSVDEILEEKEEYIKLLEEQVRGIGKIHGEEIDEMKEERKMLLEDKDRRIIDLELALQTLVDDSKKDIRQSNFFSKRRKAPPPPPRRRKAPEIPQRGKKKGRGKKAPPPPIPVRRDENRGRRNKKPPPRPNVGNRKKY